MLTLICSVSVLVLVIYLLVKRYTAQAVLMLGGLILLLCTAIFGIAPILEGKAATNLIWVDIFQTFRNLLSNRMAGLGLTIMSIGGFARYMEHIGASKSLFAVFARPLRAINSPYLLLAFSFIVTQIMVLFIPSHAGLGLLLMVTMYPILIRAGVSTLSALGVIGCCQFMDVGPGSPNAIFGAQTAGMDITEYFVSYQLWTWVPCVLAMTVVHYFVQRWWDKREGYIYDPEALVRANAQEDETRPPLIYAALPVLPLALIIGCSKMVGSTIKMDVITAMVISTVVSMVCEWFRMRDFRAVMQSLMLFFEGMSKQLIHTVSLIVCAEFFVAGLMRIGAVSGMIGAAQSAGLGLAAMVIISSFIVCGSAFLMGSGNAAFFSFAPLTPQIASSLGVPTISVLFPMQIMASFGRATSPICAAIVAISTIAGVSPFQVVKRTSIPVLTALVINYVVYFTMFYR